MSTPHRVAQYDRYGPPSVLHVATAPTPAPKPGEALVRIRGASIGGGDLLARSGAMRMVTGRKFPQRTGVDFAGTVEELSGAADFGVGDSVWGVMPHFKFGGVAEFVTVPTQRLARAPMNLELREAAALPAVGTTAITAVQDKAHLRKGERLLVRGASGGVGSVVVQLGKAVGAHVTALAGASNLDFVRSIGADEALDYRTTGRAQLGKYDVIIDAVGTELGAYRKLLNPGGRMVPLAFDAEHFGRSMLATVGLTAMHPRSVLMFSNNPTPDTLAVLTGLVETKAVTPIVAGYYPLDGIAEAHRALESGGVRGKYVIEMG
jgi:NADPH:quinone reductase-like Zn-dependent oxidoreductase